MTVKSAPPSAPEREALIESRRRDLPRPVPAPAPPSLGINADQALVRARREAFDREARIQEIDKSLSQNKRKSMRAFNRDRSR